MSNLTENQLLMVEQLRENTNKLNDILNDMISTKNNIYESMQIIVDYSSAIGYFAKKLYKEFRI
jgi:hypothetical protein